MRYCDVYVDEEYKMMEIWGRIRINGPESGKYGRTISLVPPVQTWVEMGADDILSGIEQILQVI